MKNHTETVEDGETWSFLFFLRCKSLHRARHGRRKAGQRQVYKLRHRPRGLEIWAWRSWISAFPRREKTKKKSWRLCPFAKTIPLISLDVKWIQMSKSTRIWRRETSNGTITAACALRLSFSIATPWHSKAWLSRDQSRRFYPGSV